MAGRLAAAEIDWIIERALGDTTLAVTTPTDAGPAEFYALVDKVESNWRYDKLRINRLVITIQEGQYLNWQIECVGEDETDITTTWPASPPSITCGLAFIAADATFKLGATAYPFKSLTLTIDNFVNSIYENSATPTQFEAEDLAVTVSGTFAYRSDTKALYKTALAGDTGTIVLADGTTTYTIAFPNLKLPNNGPTVPQQGEITMNLDMEAFHEDDATSTADVIKITKS